MRYLQVPIVSFTDALGVQRQVRELRPLPAFTTSRVINRSADEDFDEIASRRYVYGDGGERDASKLHEANITAIMDAKFDYSLIKSMVIPK
jgi:hypothetical protein